MAVFEYIGGGGSSSGSVTEPTDYTLKAQEALGSTIVAQTIGGQIANLIANTQLADGTIKFNAVWIPSAQTITGVKWYQNVIGNYTADNYNGIGLYSYSGGTMTLVASTTNDGNVWQTATGGTFGSKAFSSPYAASAGLYFVALLYNSSAQTSAPNLGNVGTATAAAVAGDFTNIINQAEGQLIADTGVNWVSAWPTFSGNDYAKIVTQAVSNLAAVDAIRYNMASYLSNVEATTMINVCLDKYDRAVAKLKTTDIKAN